MEELKFKTLCNNISLAADTLGDANQLLLQASQEGFNLTQLETLAQLVERNNANLKIAKHIVASQVPGVLAAAMKEMQDKAPEAG